MIIRNSLILFLAVFLQVLSLSAQRFLVYDPPLSGPKKRIRIMINDEITLKVKGDKEFYTGTLTDIRDSSFFVNGVEMRPSTVKALKVRGKKNKALIPRILGWGSQVYLGARIVNSLVNNIDPAITPVEIAILAPVIAAYYIYEFAFNGKSKIHPVSKSRPIKIVILEP